MTTQSFFNNPFSFFDQDFPFATRSTPIEGPSNALRVRRQDNESSLGLRSFRRDPFFSDFFGQTAPFGDMINRPSPFSSGSSSVHDVFDNFIQKMEQEMQAFEELEKNPPQLEDPEHTSCFMRVMTNDNGHVKVKTMKKTPETEWETHIDEYQRGNPSLKNKENEENVQIEDETEQQQQIQGSSDSQ